MVAFTIVVLVLLSLLGSIAYGLRGVSSAEGHQEAAFAANRLFELVRQRKMPMTSGFDDPATARIPIEAPPFENDFEEGSGLTRQIVTERLSDDPDSYQSKVYRIKVTVFWKIRGREVHLTLNGLTREL